MPPDREDLRETICKAGRGPASIVPDEGFGAEGFFRLFPVSRETRAGLEAWMTLLEEWGRRINLVSPRTLAHSWHRHLLDSAQWFWCRGESSRLPGRGLDLGSGAGFPGLALAIIGPVSMTLAESDRRKAAFLRQAVRVTGAPADVCNARIEDLAREGRRWPLITVRALAPLDHLLDRADSLLAEDGELWAWKGRGWKDELTAAREHWHLDVLAHASRTDPAARLLEIRGLRRKGGPRRGNRTTTRAAGRAGNAEPRAG